MSRQHRLEVFERGASHVRVLSRERPGRDSYRLSLQGEREKVEDVLPDAVRLAPAFQFSFDECQNTREGLQKLGVFVRECQQGPTAAQADLKIADIESSQQAVARAYDVSHLPLTLLIDRDGIVRASWNGAGVDAQDLARQVATLETEP